MELACGYQRLNRIKAKGLKGEAMGFNSNTLLVIRLPKTQALRVLSRSLFLAVLLWALPSIGSILTGPQASLTDLFEANSVGFNWVSVLFHDLAQQGLLKEGETALVLGSNSMDFSGFFNANEIYFATESDLDAEMSSIPDQRFDFVLSLDSGTADLVDRVLKIGGVLVMQLSNDPSDAFQQHSNYRIAYIRRFDSTIVAMRKTGLADELVNSPRKLRKCGSLMEGRRAALKGLEDVLLEPPRREMQGKMRTKFLPDLSGDSLQSYSRRVFITDDNAGSVQWFYHNYPTRDRYFEVFNLDIKVYDVEKANELALSRRMPMMVSDWLTKNVREEDFVVMKAEAQVVEEMIREKTICLVDELFLECNNKGHVGNEGKRAYWECLALYGRLRDEGVAVHQWWG